MSDKLLPCPICGINNHTIKNKTEYLYHDTWEISCGGCGLTLSICDYNRDVTYYESDIIAAWNRRFVCLDMHGKKVYAGDLIGRNDVVFGKILQMVPHDDEPWYYYEGDTGERGCETGPIELIKDPR